MVATLKGVTRRYDAASDGVKRYFQHLPSLVANYPLNIPLSYAFSQIELAHHMTLYCGMVKLHRADSELAWRAVNSQHLTRESFRDRFKTIFGKEIPASARKMIEEAEKTRDAVMHGKSPSEVDKRTALVRVIDYAEEFNDAVHGAGGFRPFGDLRGFKGRAQPLDKSTTRWLLRGMGFGM